ncbi:anti-sigma factor antagonist [Mycobacterium vicinigordonae]|uniref:Anti-sigma factor antagonist n=1 Tax=Mycobacterium vicinigordonae TaxID=1719132 RepID=A0A7D6I6D3_9MYCO|nr:anti-sigma factor antagonist [Mycobacterium vicinigordonae]QLL05717.1 anti-sigma factor antagonist [Mycobacterium vicinigordonae]
MSLAVSEVFAAPLRLSPRLVAELGAEQSTLRAAVQGFGSAVIAYVGGEIDAYNDETWRVLLAEASAFAAAPQLFIVDINSVDFMSCSSYLALAEQAAHCRERGVDLCLVSQQPSVRHIIAACGLDDVVAVYTSAPQILQLMEQKRERAC